MTPFRDIVAAEPAGPEELSGFKNGKLLGLIAENFDVFLTIDRRAAGSRLETRRGAAGDRGNGYDPCSNSYRTGSSGNFQ
jgi:hypothetical protein